MKDRFLAVVCRLLLQISLAVRDPRARAHMPALTLGLLCADRPKTITSVLEWLGRRYRDWSAYYRLLSQAKWCEDDLFRPILHSCCQLAGPPGAPLFSAQYDTLVRKTGRKIPGTAIARDPIPVRDEVARSLKALGLASKPPRRDGTKMTFTKQ